MMVDQQDDAKRAVYFLAQLHTIDGRDWTSLHRTHEDADRKLRLVAEAWGVGFNLDGEPVDGFLSYGVEPLPVLSSEESNEPPPEDLTISLTDEEVGVWRWLVFRDIPGGLSAHEMADDLGVTSEVAHRRLAGITALGMAREVSLGRYRPGSKDD
jgi:hypothetical protein